MTFYTDNTDVYISSEGGRDDMLRLLEYKEWLKENNVKYSLVYLPVWSRQYPYAINMRNEDAMMFKLSFGL